MRMLQEPGNVQELAATVADRALPLNSARDLDPVIDRVGDARFVLLGEASHGTSEFYAWRTEITKRLIAEKGFQFVAVEGDWPACMEVNRFVRGQSGHESARDALRAFQRWPTWMWANGEVAELAEWMRAHNARNPEHGRAGFYGLDVYSLWESMDEVLRWVSRHQHEALPAAVRAFECFEPYNRDEQDYASATSGWIPASCQNEVVDLLAALRRDSLGGSPAEFDVEQNALVMRNAEDYYRTMVGGGAASWNVRDRHMVETLERLSDHLGPEARGIVWEHNTHVGDARYTDMADAGMVNVGQLVREAHAPHEVAIVGFSTHRGSVVAGRHWGAPAREMDVPPARRGSWEDVLHQAGPDDRILMLDALRDDARAVEPRGHRAIGVVYDPERESWGNYVPTDLPHRYDVLLHVERTRALAPLHVPVAQGEVPETWPFGA